jgi:hypothetical protein
MRPVYVAALTMFLGACHSGSAEVEWPAWERTDRELRYRAGTELSCAPAAVQLTLVQQQSDFPTVVHAAGCGGQALFSRRLRRSFFVHTDRNTTWKLESKGPVR